MNVMKKAHELTKAKIAYLKDSGITVLQSYAHFFKDSLKQAHKAFKLWFAGQKIEAAARLYRVTATNEKTGEVTNHLFDTAGEMLSARRTMYATGLYSCLQTLDREQGEWLVDQTFHYSEAQLKEVRAHNKRIEDEKTVVGKIVSNAIKLGYTVSVYDGEEWSVKRSDDKSAIMAAVYTTDMDRLTIRDKAGELIGTVALVYGNSASEVMSDWHDNELMDKVLAPALKYCDQLSAKGL